MADRRNMTDNKGDIKKRKDNNPEKSSKRRKSAEDESTVDNSQVATTQVLAPGKIQRMVIRNFMCHDALEVNFNPNVNFIIGRNGCGKSAILTALTIGLGGRAGITKRGGSIKEMVKIGKNSGSIEITIINDGPTAFKPEDYGDTITVVRTIGSVSKYQLKNVHGKVMSTKKDELDHMLERMNIQIENPVSILNQDDSRTFLVDSNASKKYELFVRATQIDVATRRYQEAKNDTDDTHNRLVNAQLTLADSKKEVEVLEKSMSMLESVEASRLEVDQLDMELLWANVITEEKELARIEQTLTAHKKAFEDLEAATGMGGMKSEEIDARIEELKENIRTLESESTESSSSFNAANARFQEAKDTYANKKREWSGAQAIVKRTEKGIKDFQNEIKRIESMQGGKNERALRREEAATKKVELDEIEAMLRTKQTEQMHFTTDKMRLEQEERNMKIEVQRNGEAIRRTKQQLASLKQQSDNAVTVFGADMPRLLKRIDEDHKRGRFTRKPIGPLGAYVKIKNPAWTPAVETYLGYRILSAFAVDNAADCKHLGSITAEIFRGKRQPTIFSSRFINQPHNVSEMCVSHPHYKSLYEMIEISDPVVANCIIDQQEPECVLLIDTSGEASKMLSDRSRVPRNCKRALTLQGDEFFPDPQYRSYGGKVGRPKFLQVSTKEAIITLEEELVTAEEMFESVSQQHRNMQDKLKRCHAQLNEVNTQVSKLRQMQDKKNNEINRLAEQMDEEEQPESTAHLVEDLEIQEKKLAEEKEVESRLQAEVEELREASKEIQEEVSRLLELKESMDAKVNKIKNEINNLKDEKEMISLNSKRAERKLAEARQGIQKITAEHEAQKRVTDKCVSDAEKQCPRMNTRRSANDIKKTSNALKAKIRLVEQNNGSKEDIELELVKKRDKYNKDSRMANSLQKFNDEHKNRLQERIKIYKELKKRIGCTVQAAFTNILKLRNYTGVMKISHSQQTLELEITPNNGVKSNVNDARTLSGGERSYSTSAFILALWECTGLPFYFLDEFDVFMDKVNRRIMMDILLDHARTHPRNQFVFLTPLDTSIQLTDDYISIHKLEPPKRRGDATQQ